jgi:hypothetical protein
MAANTSPIFSRLGDIQWVTGSVLTGNTTKTLAAGTVFLVFTADATNGGYVDKVIAKPLGTNIATVLRLWLNNGSSTGTAANNAMIADETLAATTNSETAEIGATEIPLAISLPAGYRIYATIGTTVTAGFDIVAIGGKY